MSIKCRVKTINESRKPRRFTTIVWTEKSHIEYDKKMNLNIVTDLSALFTNTKKLMTRQKTNDVNFNNGVINYVIL